MAGATDAIFDGSVYDLPIPRLDGRKADRLVLSFSGQVELDRTSQDDLDLVTRLGLGASVDLRVTATVAKKGFALSGKDEDETTGYAIGLRVHSLEPAFDAA